MQSTTSSRVSPALRGKFQFPAEGTSSATSADTTTHVDPKAVEALVQQEVEELRRRRRTWWQANVASDGEVECMIDHFERFHEYMQSKAEGVSVIVCV